MMFVTSRQGSFLSSITNIADITFAQLHPRLFLPTTPASTLLNHSLHLFTLLFFLLIPLFFLVSDTLLCLAFLFPHLDAIRPIPSPGIHLFLCWTFFGSCLASFFLLFWNILHVRDTLKPTTTHPHSVLHTALDGLLFIYESMHWKYGFTRFRMIRAVAWSSSLSGKCKYHAYLLQSLFISTCVTQLPRFITLILVLVESFSPGLLGFSKSLQSLAFAKLSSFYKTSYILLILSLAFWIIHVVMCVWAMSILIYYKAMHIDVAFDIQSRIESR